MIGEKTLIHFIKPNNTTSIPPLCKDDIVHTEEADKASMMNDFFVEQTILDETNVSLPPNIDTLKIILIPFQLHLMQ